MRGAPGNMDAQIGQLLRWTSEAGEGVRRRLRRRRAPRARADGLRRGADVRVAERVLERVVFAPGQPVELRGAGQVGVVGDHNEISGRLFYDVTLPGNVRKTVTEDGVRPAVITDPIERLRAASSTALARQPPACGDAAAASRTSTTSCRRSRTRASRSSRTRSACSTASRRRTRTASSSPTRSASERRSRPA